MVALKSTKKNTRKKVQISNWKFFSSLSLLFFFFKIIQNDFFYLSADVAAAKAELDGLRRPQRTYNPLTIIQIKNAERNLDSRGHQDSQWWSVWHFAQYYSRLRLCATAFLCLGLLVVGLMLWSSTSYHNCQNAALCQSSNPSVLPNRLKRNAQWSKTYEDIGKLT